MLPLDEDDVRSRALAAFAHELRTPLTSLRMVMDIAAGSSVGEAVTLDAELLTMLSRSLDELDALADNLQEFSRAERGKLQFAAASTSLDLVLAAARSRLEGSLHLDMNDHEDLTGQWDLRRLAETFAASAVAADRSGAGSGRVGCSVTTTRDRVTVAFSSGEREAGPATGLPDFTFDFLRAALVASGIGCTFAVASGPGYCAIFVTLPGG